MIEFDVNRIARNAQILKFTSNQENFAFGWLWGFGGWFLETRREPGDNTVRGHHIEDVQAFDSSGRVGCVGNFVRLSLCASRNLRVSPPKGDNFVDPEI